MFKFNFKGISKKQVKKLVLENGEVINLDKVSHVLAFVENSNDKEIFFNISYNVEKKEHFHKLSNQAFLLSNVIRLIDEYKISFEDAVKMHFKGVQQEAEKRYGLNSNINLN